MRSRTLKELADAVGGRLRPDRSKPARITEVAIDSRGAGPGVVFFALGGDHTDGHEFVADALRRGAAAVVVGRDRPIALPAGATGPIVEVDDPGRALLDLARDERATLTATVVGITGSTGKTCTKDFVAAVLRQSLRVVASPASFNNEIGLPLTLLQAAEDSEAIVCEMGSRGRGHIRLLCEVARPTVGVVTNVGVAHLGLFGSVSALEAAKAELPESLPPDGTAVLNADDRVVRRYATRTAARTVLFGTASDADVRGEGISVGRETGAATFRLITPSGSADVGLRVPGEHMVSDALAAAAVGWTFGSSPDEIAGGLGEASMTGGRMELHETSEGVRVINDAYNANPSSMAAALRAARWMAGEGKCIGVLGLMAELGPISRDEHLRVGELAVRLGIHTLVVVGKEAGMIAAGARKEGIEPERLHAVDDVIQAVEVVRSTARPGDLVLVKASRVARLERVAHALLSTGQVLRGATA
jgi:UDP-N-acetylmuramoyl-tripeptide--D-alanyl-D-alanine ligase